MIRRKSKSIKRGLGKAGNKGKPLRWGSGVGRSPQMQKRSGEAPDAYLGAMDGNIDFSPALLRQQLMIFYGIYAPDKESLDEIFEILLNYTSKRGMPALNAKLEVKYGATLEGIEVPDYDEDEDEDEPPPPGDWGHHDVEKRDSMHPPLHDDRRVSMPFDDKRGSMPPPLYDEKRMSMPPPAYEDGDFADAQDEEEETIPEDVMNSLRASVQPPPPPSAEDMASSPVKKGKKPRKSIFQRLLR